MVQKKFPDMKLQNAAKKRVSSPSQGTLWANAEKRWSKTNGAVKTTPKVQSDKVNKYAKMNPNLQKAAQARVKTISSRKDFMKDHPVFASKHGAARDKFLSNHSKIDANNDEFKVNRNHRLQAAAKKKLIKKK